jgi:hypothetical protein
MTSAFGLIIGSGGLVFALVALLRDPRSLSTRVLTAGMVLLALETIFISLSENAVSAASARTWFLGKFWTMSCVPGTWLWFSLIFARGNQAAYLKQWRGVLGLTFLLPLVCASMLRLRPIPGTSWVVKLEWPGLVLEAAVLVASVLILMNLERTFRATVGTMRWRVKFMILGLSLIFGVRIYTCSLALLYSAVSVPLEGIQFAALGLGTNLMAWSSYRTGQVRVEVYPAPAITSNSLTVILAGLYLMIVGIIARIVTAMGNDRAFPLQSFLVLVGLSGLALLLMSDRMRQTVKRFVSRHFNRPYYNYRRVWTSFTEAISPRLNEKDLCRTAADFISSTLQLL